MALPRSTGAAISLLTTAVSLVAAPVVAQTSLSGEPIRIVRATGPIIVDGQLNDEGWRNVPSVEKWYETNPGDNPKPPVKSVGYLAYDERFLYAAFEFADPNPRAIRSPYADHDHISGN